MKSLGKSHQLIKCREILEIDYLKEFMKYRPLYLILIGELERLLIGNPWLYSCYCQRLNAGE